MKIRELSIQQINAALQALENKRELSVQQINTALQSLENKIKKLEVSIKEIKETVNKIQSDS